MAEIQKTRVEAAADAPLQGASLRRLASVLVSLGELVDGYDLLVMGAALLFLRPYFHLTVAQIGLLGAASFIGSALGLLIFGDMSDRIGRRTIFLFNLIFFVVFSIACALVNTVPLLIAARFLVGVGVGMDIPTSTAFLAEIAPTERRGRFAGTLPNVMWLIGAIVSVLLALVIAPMAGKETWRWLFGLAAVPAFLVLLGRRMLPESPRWLRQQGRHDEARAVFARLDMEEPTTAETGRRVSYLDSFAILFRPPYLVRTLAMSGVFCFNCFAGAVVSIAGPFVLKSTGLSTSQSLTFSVIGYAVDMIGVLIGFAIIDRVSRRWLGVLTSAGAAAAGFLMAFAATHSPMTLVAFYFIFAFLLWLGPGVLVWVWASELFPTHVRATASGLTQATCRLAIAANIVLVPLGIAAFKLQSLAIFAAAYVVVALLILAFPFFNTTQRPLEELA